MKKLIFAAFVAATTGGCYIGKAAFQGEDMKIYPFFGPSAGTAESPKHQPANEILSTDKTSSIN